MRPRVYIAGPITKGNLADNVNQATAMFVQLAKLGFAPLCPHWSVYSKPCGNADWQGDRTLCYGTRNGNRDMSHADWIGVDLPWVEVADALIRLPGDSSGADAEVSHAVARGVPVFYDLGSLVAHFQAAGCV